MNLFNRIVVILLILAVMIFVPLALIFPEQTESVLRSAADIIRANIDWLDSLTTTGQIGVRLMLAAVGMIVFLIGLLLLVLEIVRVRRKTVQLKDRSGEMVMDGVAGHLAYYVDLLPDVVRVRPVVQSTGKSVRATLYVDTAPGVNVPAKSAEIQETAITVLEDQLGLKVKGGVKVVVRPVPPPEGAPGTLPPPPIAPREAVEESHPVEDIEVVQVKTPAPDAPADAPAETF